MSTFAIVLIALVICALVVIKKSLVIIPQSETKIIERLGKYYATLKPGINIIIPFIDRAKEIVAVRRGRYLYTDSIDLREQVYDFDKQNVITKDNVQTQINALLYFQIVDPFKAVYEINNLPNAIEKLTQTTLRNIIGELELDETLTSRDTINTRLRAVLDDATNKWGIKVNRVELQDITPPQTVLQAMEKQMQAERNKRAEILTSEGEKASAILKSEGEKTAIINRAEADLTLDTLEKYFAKIGKQRILDERIDVGIISPYRAQVQLLRRLIRKKEFFKPSAASYRSTRWTVSRGRSATS
mgnify:CR=1 FL=1